MSEKKCHISTRGEKCELEHDICFFNVSNFPLPYIGGLNKIRCALEATERISLNSDITEHCKCFWEGVSRDQFVNFAEKCFSSVKKIDPNIKITTYSDPLFSICAIKCSYLISVGEFIERYLHLPKADIKVEDYFKKAYCPADDDGTCINKMLGFYNGFYIELDKLCTSNCIVQCINEGGPPEFYNNGGFTYDIFIPLKAYSIPGI